MRPLAPQLSRDRSSRGLYLLAQLCHTSRLTAAPTDWSHCSGTDSSLIRYYMATFSTPTAD